MIRTYSELIKIGSFEDRYNYLRLFGSVGAETFGFDRYLNQMLYHGAEWKRVKDKVISRDRGCDLAFPGFEIRDRVYVHHMNPITRDDIINRSDFVLNPEYLICCSFNTHQAIHYGDEKIAAPKIVERTKNDTCPWR